MSSFFIRGLLLFTLIFFLLGCSLQELSSNETTPPSNPPFPPSSNPPIWKAPPSENWHLQLTGRVDLLKNATVYEIDLESTSAEDIAFLHSRGKYVICYLAQEHGRITEATQMTSHLISLEIPLSIGRMSAGLMSRALRCLQPLWKTV